MIISFLDLFEKTVSDNNEKTALIHNDKRVSFAELRKQAQTLAGSLRKSTGKKGPVAVLLPKCTDIVAADIGIMYSCNPYMNLDIKTPAERLMNIIEKIEPVLIVTDSTYKEVLKGTEIPMLDIGEILAQDNDNSDLLQPEIIDTDAMCIINTSGSTGTPKGVALTHRSFIDFFLWAKEEYGFDGTEVIGSLSPAVFDIYDSELCMMMALGSTIVLLDGMLAAFPVKLLQVLKLEKVNFIFWVPSIMVNIANMDLLEKIELPDLKTVWFAGEVFPTKQFCYWFDHLRNADFSNLYGPIEITLDCTFFRIKERPDETVPLPIGIPCRNTDILILNENNEKCIENEEGELCVRGTSLALGYYNDLEKTKSAFVQNPLNHSYPEKIYRTGDIVYLGKDGLIHFKGRRDSLIKHLGYRIELGEIEHLLVNDLEIVDYCCAVYNHAEKKIVLIYESENEIEDKTFRSRLKEKLPSYMIPGKYKRMDILPRNNNGKIDRNKLQQEEDKA